MSNTVGERIRKLRTQKKLTLDELAQAISSSKSYVWEIENKNKAVSAEKLQSIAYVLNTTTDFLLGGADFMLNSEVSTEEDARDKAFYRKYKDMDAKAKATLQRMLEVLDEEE